MRVPKRSPLETSTPPPTEGLDVLSLAATAFVCHYSYPFLVGMLLSWGGFTNFCLLNGGIARVELLQNEAPCV